MARKPGSRASGEFVLFNVYYEDDTLRSNRRVPAEILGGLDRDEPAKPFIEQQDREISEKSGMAPMRVKRVVRADDDVKDAEKERERNARRHERRAGAR
jgi:hypothetical protein